MRKTTLIVVLGLLLGGCIQGSGQSGTDEDQCPEILSIWEESEDDLDSASEEISTLIGDDSELEGEQLQLSLDLYIGRRDRATAKMAVLAEQHPVCFTVEERLDAETEFRMSLLNKIDRAVFRLRD